MNFSPEKRLLKPRTVHIILAICLSSFLLCLLAPKFTLPISPQDEGILLVYPELILKGFIPNRDFATMYPPGNFWLLSLAYSILGASVFVERSVGFLYLLAIVLGIFFLSTRFGLCVAFSSAVVSCIILRKFPTFGAFSWFGGVALALWSLVIASWASFTDKNRYIVGLSLASGMLSGAGILFRIDLALVTVLSSMTVLGIAKRRNTHAYILGLAIGLIPLIVHVFYATFGSVFDNLVLDVLRIGLGRQLPINFTKLKVWAVGISSILTFIIGLALYIMNRNSRRRVLFGIGIFTVGLLPQAVQRADTWHMIYVGCVTIPLFIVVLSEVWRSGNIAFVKGKTSINWFTELRNRTPSFVPLATTLGISSALALWGVIDVVRPVTGVVSSGRVVPVNSDSVADTQSLIDEVHELASPGELLFVGPRDLSRTNYGDSFLYFLFPELIPASYYLEMNPGSANRSGSSLSSDIKKAHIVILNKEHDLWDENNASKNPGALEPSRVVESQFCLHKSIGRYDLLVRCGTSEK